MSEQAPFSLAAEVLKRFNAEPPPDDQVEPRAGSVTPLDDQVEPPDDPRVVSALEGKILTADLMDRITELDALVPGEAVPSPTMVNAVFTYCQELTELARETALRFGIQVDATLEVEGETIPVYDFSFPTHDQFLEGEAAAQQAEAVDKSDPGAIIEPLALTPRRELLHKVISKIGSALGVGPATDAIVQTLEAMAKSELDDLVRVIRERRFQQAKKPLVKILNKMISKNFRKRLAQRIGAAGAAKITARIAARSVPIIGWATVVAAFVWACAAQVF